MTVPYNSMQPRHWSNDPSGEEKRSLEKNFLPIAMPAPKKKERRQHVESQSKEEFTVEDRGDTVEIPRLIKETITIIDLNDIDEETNMGTDAVPAKPENEEENVAKEKDNTMHTEREQPDGESIVQAENCMANSAECFVTFKEDIDVGVAASLDCFAHGVNKLKELDFTPMKESKAEATVTSEETNIDKES